MHAAERCGISSQRLRPMISSRSQPNSRSACALTILMCPCQSTITIASGADSSSARNLRSEPATIGSRREQPRRRRGGSAARTADRKPQRGPGSRSSGSISPMVRSPAQVSLCS